MVISLSPLTSTNGWLMWSRKNCAKLISASEQTYILDPFWRFLKRSSSMALQLEIKILLWLLQDFASPRLDTNEENSSQLSIHEELIMGLREGLESSNKILMPVISGKPLLVLWIRAPLSLIISLFRSFGMYCFINDFSLVFASITSCINTRKITAK